MKWQFREQENQIVRLSLFVLACVMAAALTSSAAASDINFKMKSLDGKDVDLPQKYKAKVLLVVNVASQCGLTPQYTELEALHEKYADKGLCVLGFPCNQFGKQEPGTADEIREFCTSKYGVKFDMFAKIDVNGDGACPLYKRLTALPTQPKDAGDITWNFEKFLVGRDGKVVARYAPRTKPNDPLMIAAIEAELGK